MAQPPSNQPVSFKTVPGRNRTQKWSQAKTYNYDGDDWGSYDPYDEYGGYEEEASQRSAAPQQQHGHLRQNSFDRGVESETRQFSAGYAQPQARDASPAVRSQTSDNASERPSTTESKTRMREFSNPGQVPMPLQTRASPAAERPPRKSSLSSASPGPETSSAPAVDTDKPLPFIRPSDIYKRMAEDKERERQSMDSSRPSLDSVQRSANDSPSWGLTSKRSQESLPSSGRRPSMEPVSEERERIVSPLAPVDERPTSGERSFDGFAVDSPALARALGAGVASPTSPASPTSSSLQESAPPPARQEILREDSRPQLPPVGRLSGFGSLGIGFLSSDEKSETAPLNTRAPAGSDPAAYILAEMQQDSHVESLGRTAHEDPSGLISHSSDPAAEIAAERQLDPASSHLGRAENEDPSGLSHQPSSGFRSVVHTAFDRKDDDSIPPTPVSHDNLQNLGNSGAGVGRSDTNSTSSISPIMSRVPSAATAKQKQQERDVNVPPIAEETSPTHSRAPSGTMSRKPVHSRNASAEIPGFEQGYRRSLETPSPNNSPARTLGLEDTRNRRFSGPMAAQISAGGPEGPDVAPEATEAPAAVLHSVDTASAVASAAPTPAAEIPGVGNPADYAHREADLADEISSSPDKGGSPDLSSAARESQSQFLRTHPAPGSGPASPIRSPATGIPRATTPVGTNSGRNSPAGGSRTRVKHIVSQYHQIDDEAKRHSTASGTSSKSSWSNFGSQENLGLKRKGTGGSGSLLASPGGDDGDGMSPSSPDRQRPEPAGRLESFRPHLPGEWVSYAGTPGPQPSAQSESGITDDDDGRTPRVSREVTPAGPLTPRAQEIQRAESSDSIPDLTPTTRKTQLRGSEPRAEISELSQYERYDRESQSDDEVPDFAPTARQPKSSDTNDEPGSAKSALRSVSDALAASLASHQVGYGHQTQDFAAPKTATPPPVEVPETEKREYGDIYRGHNVPVPGLLVRNASEMTVETTGSWGSGTETAGSDKPPTPPAKDTGYGLNPPNANAGDDRPISGYFSGASAPDETDMAPPPPLKVSRSGLQGVDSGSVGRPTVLPTLSTDTGVGDTESDRLRKDIVRTLSPDKRDELKRGSILETSEQAEEEDVERTQHALDASARNAQSPPSGRSGLPSQAGKPGFLDQRFPWEKAPESQSLHVPSTTAVGELEDDKDRRSYERPRSSQGLHVINTQVEADSEPNTAVEAERGLQDAQLPMGTESLVAESQGLSEMSPAPIADDDLNDRTSHIPSYYGGALSGDADADAMPPATATTTASETSPPSVTKSTTSPTTKPASSSGRIPPFREILTIKNTSERIAKFSSTRQTFASMDTGLNNWLSNMLVAHPEHANLSAATAYPAPAAVGTGGLGSGLGSMGKGHRHSPSILKMTKNFGSNSGESPTSAGSQQQQRRPSGQSPAGGTGSGSQGVDVERMQARGKDLIKSAGSGAKGLLKMGRSRFGRGGGGGEKALLSTASPHTSSSSPLAKPPAAPPAAAPAPSAAPSAPAATTTPAESSPALTATNPDPNTSLPNETPLRRPSLMARLRSASRSASRSLTSSGRKSSRDSRPPSSYRPPSTPLSIRTETPSRPPTAVQPETPVQATEARKSRSRSRSRSRARSLAAATELGTPKQPGAMVPSDVPAVPGEMVRRSAERSRSRSRSASASISRVSLVPGNSGVPALPTLKALGLNGDTGILRRREDWETDDFAFPGAQTGSMAVGARKEAWEDENVVPQSQKAYGSGGNDEEKAARLGVLPSPATDGGYVGTSPKRSDFAGGDELERVPGSPATEGVRTRPGTPPAFLALRRAQESIKRLTEPQSPSRVEDPAVTENKAQGDAKDDTIVQPTPVHPAAAETPVVDKDVDAATESASESLPQTTASQPVTATPTASPPIAEKDPNAATESTAESLPQTIASRPVTATTTAPPQTADKDTEPTAEYFPQTIVSRPVTATTAAITTAPTTPVRPQQQRKVSALSELPSQQRNRRLSQPPSQVVSPTESPLASPRRQHATPVKFGPIPTPAMIMAGLNRRGMGDATAGANKEDDVFATPLTPSGDVTAPGGISSVETQQSGSNAGENNKSSSIAPAASEADITRLPSLDADKRSLVSAPDDKPDESKGGKDADVVSRRSSVSSLGSPSSYDTVIAHPMASNRQSMVVTPGALVSTSMPGGFDSSATITPSRQASMQGGAAQRPVFDRAASSQSLSQEQLFANRGYAPHPDERPMSYMPLSRDSSGNAMQEMLGRRSRTPSGSLSGIPIGARTPPFTGQGHSSRRSSMARPPSLGRPPSEYDRLRSPQPEDVEPATTTDRRSKRFSGFFRGSQPTPVTSPPPSTTVLPTPSQVQEFYDGLEDPGMAYSGDELTSAEQPTKQSKRRSGMWKSLSRAPSTTLSSLSRRNSSHGIPGQAAPAPQSEVTDSKPKTLKKLNRATSSAVSPEEPKKKRFSRLGSIFGRSNTNSTAKPNRLTKTLPPTQQSVAMYTPSSATGVRGGYEAYEAAKRRQSQMPTPQYYQQPYVQPQPAEVELMMSSPYREEPPAQVSPVTTQQRPPSWTHSRQSSLGGTSGGHQPQPLSPQHSRQSSTVGSPASYASPPIEYYGTQAPQSPPWYGPEPINTMSPPPLQPTPPAQRRLHSAGHQRQEYPMGVPRAYGNVGPFNNHQSSPPPQSSNGLIHEGAQTARQIPSAYPRPGQRSRQSSYNGSPQPVPQQMSPDQYFLQRQTSYNSNEGQSPPNPGHQNYQPQYAQYEQYSQSTRPPMAPLQTSGNPGSRTNSLGSIDKLMARSPAQEYPDQQTPYPIGIPGAESQDQWAPSRGSQQRIGPPRAAAGAVGQRRPPQYYQQYDPRAFSGNGNGNGYASPPPQFQAPRSRYYNAPPEQGYYGNSGEGRPLTFQRTTSGFTGRRDDAALGEAELMAMGNGMRGSSYPGQEWVPGGRF